MHLWHDLQMFTKWAFDFLDYFIRNKKNFLYIFTV